MGRSIYRTINADDFPAEVEISWGRGSERQILSYEKVTWDIAGTEQGLRYGENPDQPAALYRLVNGNVALGEVVHLAPGNALASGAQLLQSGKHPGKINITDVDAALNILRYFTDTPTCVIVKHNNPSGVAQADTPEEAYERALVADRIAAFGGAIAINRPVTAELAQRIVDYYAEVVVAPDYDDAALRVFATRKNLRVLAIQNLARLQQYVGQRVIDFKTLIDGGFIAQWSFAPRVLSDEELIPAQTVHEGQEYTVRRAPTPRERADMRFGWLVESGVTSNSVIYVKDRCTVAIGTGEQDRVGVARIARDKAYWKYADRIAFSALGRGIEELDSEQQAHYLARSREEHGGLDGATIISDAFFPFRDGAEIGLAAGCSAILQPGGALRDWDIIDLVNAYDATMAFTGQRSFRH